MKGNAFCHTYTRAGRENHDEVEWNNDGVNCEHRRSVGRSGNICLKSDHCPFPDKSVQKCGMFKRRIKTSI